MTLRVPRPDHGFPLGGREVAGDEEVAEAELNKEEWEVVMGDDETAHTQEQFAQKRTAQGESSLGETDEPQEPAAMLNGPAADEMTHNQSTSIPPQAPMTPPPNPPVPSDEPPFAHDSNQPPEQHHEQEPSSSPAQQTQLSDQLPRQHPQAATARHLPSHPLTYDELIRPFLNPHLPPAPGMREITQILQDIGSLGDGSYQPGVDEEEDADLPSLMMRPPVTEYMRQFERDTDEEIGWEMYWR